MAIVQRAADVYYTFRFLRQLVTPWNETQAYKLGLIDADGKKLKSATTAEEKDAYTLFFRLVYNLKRLLNKIPFGKTKLASYAAALWLVKENTKMSDKAILEGFMKYAKEQGIELDTNINESKLWMVKGENLLPGKYKLAEHCISSITGETVAFKGSMIIANEMNSVPHATLGGINLYTVYHPSSKQHIYVTLEDIYR
ncbi:hypothetical protein [Lake Baikal phage Baikal-20-5m-C28]|nr:hypothetical protein [Lake Baikal phage Baikal-20-5m-C28]